MNKYHLILLVYKWHSPEMNLIHWNWMVRNGNGLHTKRMEWRLFLLILVKCVTCFGFLTLHSKHNIFLLILISYYSQFWLHSVCIDLLTQIIFSNYLMLLTNSCIISNFYSIFLNNNSLFNIASSFKNKLK